MGRRISAKLKTNSGVSIIFALFAMLICSVVSVVLIRSVTASAGRASNLSETDQRYYSVVSAADTFKSSMEKYTLILERTKENTSTVIRSYESDGSTATPVGSPSTVSSDTYAVKRYYRTGDGAPVETSSGDIFSVLSMNMLFGSSSVGADASGWTAAYPAITPQDDENENSYSFEYTIEPSVDSDDSAADVLKVDVKVKLLSTGVMDVTFTSDSGEKFQYSIRMLLKANVSETLDESTKVNAPVVQAGDTESRFTQRVTTVTTQTKKTVLSWQAA